MAANNVRNLKPKRNSTDGLVNVVTGLGTGKSKREHNQWAYDLLNNFMELDAAYQSNWIARQIVDVVANDMTREWRRIKANDAEAIALEEQRLGLQLTTQTAIAWARLFGGAGVLMLTDQDLGEPLQVNKIKKGGLKRFIVFDRWELNATSFNTANVLAPNYLMPEYYTLQGGAQRVHWTHIARFYGERLPRRQMAQVQGWGDSVLRKCIKDLGDTVAAKVGIANLLQEANLDVINTANLADDLASDQEAAIIKRYALFAQMKSNINMALLDEDEVLTRQTLNLTGVAPSMEMLMTWMAGAARIPVTKLFGTSAKGMNATGDGDLTNYNDDIRSDQISKLTDPLQVIDEVLVRSALGTFPEDYDYVWNPLNQKNELEIAQAQLMQSQKNIAYLDANIVMKSQIMRELQSAEEYQFDEDMIDDLDELEDPLLFNDLPDIGGDEPEVETTNPNQAPVVEDPHKNPNV